jgi:hypothetical protein
MSTNKEMVRIQPRQKRHRYAIGGAYQANGRTPSVRGGGGRQSVHSWRDGQLEAAEIAAK